MSQQSVQTSDGAFLSSKAISANFNELYAYAPINQTPNNYRNAIDGGDFQTNPWQRGTSFTGIANTITYGPDRFWAYGASSSAVQMVKTANTNLAGFTQALAFGRNTGTDVNPIYLGQTFESADSFRFQGQTVTFSFWAKAGANYSGGTVTVQVNTGITALDGSAANQQAAGWTGPANPVAGSFTPTATMTRYQFTGTLGAAITQIGVMLFYTPTGTAGTADNILFHGFQFEVGAYASPFEFKDVAVELEIAQRYFVQYNEPAAGVVIGAGLATASGVETIFIPLPVQMRKAPTVTVSVGTFCVAVLATSVSAGTFAAGATHTANAISVTATAACTAGQSVLLIGGSGGTGTIKISAEY